ncbi:flippase-like domain-containing protein [Archaeoglobus sp.]
MKERIKATVALIISIVTIAILFHISNFEVSLSILRTLDYKFLAIAFLLQVFFWLLWALRLKVITKALGSDIDYRYSLITTLSSMFFAAITPSSAGGEPVRVKMVADVCKSYGTASAAILIERLLDAIFFVISLPILVILTGFYVGLGFKVAGVFSLFLLSFISLLYTLLKSPKKIEKFIGVMCKYLKRFLKGRTDEIMNKLVSEALNFRSALIDILKSKSYACVMFLLTIVMWLLGFLIPSFILLAMHLPPYFLFSITAQVIIVVVSLIPLTPGSSGIAEGTMAYLYSSFVPQSALGVLVAIWRAITYYTNLFFGFLVSLKIIKD